MPIYEYHCGKCGDFEVMQKISDKPLSTCPTCRRKVTKLISSTSFQLKGSGWYVTDYARKSGSGSASTDDKPAKGDDKTATADEKSGKAGDKGTTSADKAATAEKNVADTGKRGSGAKKSSEKAAAA